MFINENPFPIADSFAQHRVPYCRWQSLTAHRQQALLKAFLTDDGRQSKPKQTLVTSSDGSLTVNGTNRVARKPGQRRRPKSERTVGKKVAQK